MANATRWCSTTALDDNFKQLRGDVDSLMNSHKTSGGVSQTVLKAVVKVFTVTQPPNYLIPWQRKFQTNITGSGFVVDKPSRLLLTNSHVVANASFVEVRKHGDPQKYTADIVYIGADCDLAVLLIDDAAFWEGDDAPALDFQGASSTGIDGCSNIGPFEGVPELQQTVKVVGYPVGGDQISITSGVVSRVDMTPYGGLDSTLISIQIDAAINSGNSGGPAVCNNTVVGVAFQSLVAADNIGYIIPNPIVAAFLREFRRHAATLIASKSRGYFPGFCSLGVYVQEATNDTLKSFFKLPKNESGVLIQEICSLAPCKDVLQPDDVIVEVDGYTVASDATIKWRGHERISFTHCFHTKQEFDAVDLRVLRNGEYITIHHKLGFNKSLVPNHLCTDALRERPVFFVFGGCVFTMLSIPMFFEWGQNEWYNSAPRFLVDTAVRGRPTEELREIVTAVQLIPHSVNKGYSPDAVLHRVVESVNGVKVSDFNHFKQLVEALPDDSLANLSLRFSVAKTTLVLPVKEAREADASLRSIYNIPTE